MAKILTQNHDDSGTPPDRLIRTRLIEVTEEWIRYCDEFPGCKAAEPSKPCCGDGFWTRVSEDA